MFAKVFSQIFDSSISGDYVVRHVFMDLLVLADRDGVVDMTMDAIARRTNVPEDVVAHAIQKLMEPDAQSRSGEEDGRRMVLLDSHRNWGWQIVNYHHYRLVRDDDARRTYFRDKKREHRSDDPPRKRGYIYYASSELGIKIGHSANPWSRINELRVSSPTLTLMAVEHGDVKLERSRHEQFKEDRIEREWFRASRPLLAHVATLATLATSNSVPTTVAMSTKAEAEAEAEAEVEVEEKKQRQVRSAKPAEPPPAKATDKKPAVALPDWLPVEPWEAWVEMRRKTKKPLTDYAMTLAINKLAKFHQDGYDVQEIINAAVVGNWQGFFIPKDADGNRLKPKPKEYEYVECTPEEFWKGTNVLT